MPRHVLMTAPGAPLTLADAPAPTLVPGAARVRTLLSEVCGTDVHLWHGRLSGVPYPIVPGHVNVVELLESNGALRDVDGREIRPGERFTFYDVHGTCGRCWQCAVAKTPTRCPHRRVYGITLPASEGLLGGWSEEILLLPGVQVVRLPEQLPTEEFIGGGCGLPTAFHAIERSTPRLGSTFYIQGTGPVGLSCIVFAARSGAERVFVSGAPALRLEAARAMGADHVLDLDATRVEDRVAWLRDATHGRGVDVVIEASGNPQAVPEGLAAVRDGGVYTIVGQYTDHGAVAINPHTDINRRHVEIRGCWGYDFSHLYRATALMARHADEVRWRNLISARYPLARAEEALRAVMELKVVKAVIDPTVR